MAIANLRILDTLVDILLTAAAVISSLREMRRPGAFSPLAEIEPPRTHFKQNTEIPREMSDLGHRRRQFLPPMEIVQLLSSLVTAVYGR